MLGYRVWAEVERERKVLFLVVARYGQELLKRAMEEDNLSMTGGRKRWVGGMRLNQSFLIYRIIVIGSLVRSAQLFKYSETSMPDQHIGLLIPPQSRGPYSFAVY